MKMPAQFSIIFLSLTTGTNAQEMPRKHLRVRDHHHLRAKDCSVFPCEKETDKFRVCHEPKGKAENQCLKLEEVSRHFEMCADDFCGLCPNPTRADNVTRKEGAKKAATDDSLMVVPLFDLPLDKLDPTMVLDTSDPKLWKELLSEAQSARIGTRPFSVNLGLSSGHNGKLKLNLNVSHADYNDLFSYPKLEISPEPDGFCSVDTMLFIYTGDDDNMVRFQTVDPDVVKHAKSSKTEGGCCAILAVAHGLVRKMGSIVPKNQVTDGKHWDPCFLHKIWKASGDTDNNRGLTNGESRMAHEADWNDSWQVWEGDDDSPLYTGTDISAAQLKQRCQKLQQRVQNTNDAVTMRIRGKDDTEWGHRVPVEAVTFTETTSLSECDITVTETSVQEPSGTPDFKNIVFNPGTAKYFIAVDDNGETIVRNTEFPSATILRLVFDSFDEERKNDDVKPTDQGNMGTAFNVACPASH